MTPPTPQQIERARALTNEIDQLFQQRSMFTLQEVDRLIAAALADEVKDYEEEEPPR